MEYIKDFQIEGAVIHIIDTSTEEAVLNEIYLELEEETYSFLYKHIFRCINDEELKYANFKEGDLPVKKICEDYRNNTMDLLEVSQKLAVHFFEGLKLYSMPSSCDFIVSLIKTDIGSFIAILRMDYTKNYIHSIEVVEGKLGIKITPQMIGLPGSTQKLKSSAFIKISSNKDVSDIMLINREDKDKNFFGEEFLGCSIFENERDKTKNFVKAAEDFTRKSYKETADTAEIVRSSIKRKLKEDDDIDILELSKEVFIEEEKQRDFIEFVKAKGVGEKIKIDKDWLDKKYKRIRLKLDKDIDLYIDEDTYSDNKRFEIRRNGDGTINMIIKHVTNYIEK
ncbi:MAG TPA: nucleoid-associated protein [Clostridiaceae bacterium]